MLNIKAKITTAAVTGALIFSAITPAFAATDIQVSGNGSRSDNNVSVSQSHTTTVDQSNDADFNNDIRTSSNTGNNRASGNTGGDVSIDTGNTSSFVGISNMANMNQASLGNTGGNGDTDINVSGNGSRSDTTIDVDMDSDTNVSQDNRSRIDNMIDSRNSSGNNWANDNTGRNSRNSSVDISTGDSDSEVLVSNSSNWNSFGNGNNQMMNNHMGMRFNRMNNGMNSWMSDFQNSMHNMRMR